MVRSRFDSQLEQLDIEMIKMGALCEEAITASMKAFIENDDAAAKVAFDKESEIDRKERDIEALCMRLLLQQQPVARDLRLISSALKMISDMERIGDQAADIAEITAFVKDNETKSKLHFRDMAAAAVKMVTESVDSFVNKDLKLAKSVMDYDDVLDNLFTEVKQELIDLIGEDRANGEFCIDLIMIAKYLERIGDHATNIAEWVEYSITGSHVKMGLEEGNK
ncbi:phosphate signaling complex protein PhoU [Anaerotignum sp.]|uniref:phosphate signaling complex protein PhoU n=1 Tax=Anaerotignum sp. TaxID=2039241 RepID=UPI00271509D5|nr:phosphate signaling complex protein PhoU [Anaerotignum sp.]